MKYQKCPVCQGRGEVPHDFYYSNHSPTVINTSIVECRTCRGRGVLLLEDQVCSTPSENCYNCGNKQPYVCLSDPPQVQCKLDNSFHRFEDTCDQHVQEDVEFNCNY